MQQNAVEFLRGEGSRLGSMVLASLTVRVSGDPFVKVKKLIQELIERLVQEATAEATKKGFCDTEMGKANNERKYRMASVLKLNAELKSLEVQQEELEVELEELGKDLKGVKKDFKSAIKDREETKSENLQT